MSERAWWAALVLGAVCAGFGMVRAPGHAAEGELPDTAVARVGDAFILRADYERALRGVASDRRSGRLSAADRQRVLQRMVDEELLVQHGVQLGVAQTDPQVRAQLVQSVLALVRAESDGRADESALRAFYAEHAEYFRERGSGRLPAFEQARPRVLSEWRRRHQERDLAELLDALRRGDVVLGQP